MVKITLEYGSVEEAIQALGKLSGLAKVRRAATATGAELPADAQSQKDQRAELPAVAAPTRQRKPRNDAGKPRGPHKKAGAEAQTAVGQVATAETAQETAARPADQPGVTESGGTAGAAQPDALPGPSTVPGPDPRPAPASPTPKDAEAALESYFSKNGPQKAMALLASFGVSKLRELPEKDRAAFIAKCGE